MSNITRRVIGNPRALAAAIGRNVVRSRRSGVKIIRG
jgi:hypothetical protein